MRNGKYTQEYAVFWRCSVTDPGGIDNQQNSIIRKCTHLSRWVHNKTIARAFVLTIGAFVLRIALSFYFGCKTYVFIGNTTKSYVNVD